MYRGTTPTLVFDFEQDLQSLGLENFFITFKQDNSILFEKELKDVIFQKDKMLLTLTQDDTLKFSDSSPIEIQSRFKLKNGDVFSTNIIKTSAKKILKEGEI